MGKKTNYSYKTSLPPYRENPEGKQLKKQEILAEITRLGGTACLKQLENALKIPQSTIAGRVNDLKDDGKIVYDGTIEFEGRLRKKIVLKSNVVPITPPAQPLPEAAQGLPESEKAIPVQQQLKFG